MSFFRQSLLKPEIEEQLKVKLEELWLSKKSNNKPEFSGIEIAEMLDFGKSILDKNKKEINPYRKIPLKYVYFYRQKFGLPIRKKASFAKNTESAHVGLRKTRYKVKPKDLKLISTKDFIKLLNTNLPQYDSVYYKQALKIAKKSGDQRGIGANIHDIGLIYLDMKNYNRAIKEFKKSLTFSKKIGDQKGVATSLQQIGVALNYKGEFKKAVKNFNQSLKTYKEIKDQKGIAITNYYMANLYWDRKDSIEALIHLELSLAAFRKMGYIMGMASTISLIGKIHLEKQNFKEAIIYCRMVIALFEMINSPEIESSKLDLEKIRFILGNEEFERINKEINEDL